jgi:hypothetical protein
LFSFLTKFVSRKFLERIIPAVETLLLHYLPQIKAQSKAWNCQTSPVAKKIRSQPSAGKIMLSVFWYMESAVLAPFTPKNETVNSHISVCFAHCENALRGRRISSDKLTGMVQDWIQKQTIFFYKFKKHVKLWNRCVEVERDYIEK